METSISLQEFAERLKVAFPALKAVTVSPYIPNEHDNGLDENGRPFLVEIALYSEKGCKEILAHNGDPEPLIWNERSGWSVVEGYITSMPLCIRDSAVGDEMIPVPVDIDAYVLPDGTVDWRNAIAVV